MDEELEQPDTFALPEATPPAEVMQAIIPQESSGNPNAISPKGAMGLTQVMPDMWKAYGGGDPYDGEENLRVGTAIYTDELLRFGGNEKLAIAAYNAGSPNIIKALKAKGYSLKDAPYVDYDEIADYLPDETQNYVPKVLSNLNKGKQSSYEETPEEAIGNSEDLKSGLTALTSDPSFGDLPNAEAFNKIKELYDSKGYWTPEADLLLKKASTVLIDTALPDEKPNYSAIVGPPPELSLSDTDPDKTLDIWRTSKLRELSDAGINPNFLGDQLDDYFTRASESEKTAARYRARGLGGQVASQVGGAISMYGRGAVGSVAAVAAAPFRLAGDESTADSIESIAEIIPEAPRDFGYAVDEKGNVRFDVYGEPITNYRAGIMSGLGQVSTVIAGGAGVATLGGNALAVGTFIGGANTLQTMNDAYKDARENGGTNSEAFKAAWYSLPSAGIDTLGDIFVAGSNKVWLKALNKENKIRALSRAAAEGFVAEGSTEVAQQYLQDLGTSTAINKDITSEQRLIEAGIAGGVAGGVARPILTSLREAPRPPERFPPPDIGESGPLGLPPGTNPPQQGLPPGSAAVPELQGPIASTKQLDYQPQTSSSIELGSQMAALSTPDPDEQTRIALEFEKLQESKALDKVLTIRSPLDLDKTLLESFGYTAEVLPDGRYKITKQLTYIPGEVKNNTPEGTDLRIKSLTEELASAPKSEDGPYLVQRRRELKQQIADLSPEVKQKGPVLEQLRERQLALKKELTRLNLSLRKRGANKRLINVRKQDARAELKELDEFLKQDDPTLNYIALKTELRNVNEALKLISRPTYVNDTKAKELELQSLMLTRDIGQEEFQQETKDKAEKEDRFAEQKKNLELGIGIKAGRTTNWVLPFDNKWYVLNERGTPLSVGMNDFVDAVDAARGILTTETEGGLKPRITPTPPRGKLPLRFKQRIEVPWYIITSVKDLQEDVEGQKEEFLANEKKVEAKLDAEEKELSTETKLAEPAFAKGKVTSSKKVNPEVTKFIRYLTRGFGLPDIAVGTFEEFDSGELDAVLPEQTKLAFDAFSTKDERKQAKGAAYFNKGKGVILLRSGDRSLDTAVTVAHEVGHLVQDVLFNKAPAKVQMAVENDFKKAKAEIFSDPNTTVEQAAEKLQGATNQHAGDTRLISSLKPGDAIYLFSNTTGFREFFANQVVPFALDETKAPIGESQGFYKKLGDAFKQLWNNLKNKFVKSPTLEQWLKDQFKSERAMSFLKEATDRAKSEIGAVGEGQKERRFSKRVSEDPSVEKEVREKVKDQTYNPKSPKEAAAKVRSKIDPLNIDKSIREVLDNKNELTSQERTAYAIEIINELGKQISVAKAAGKPIDSLVETEAEFVKAYAEAGTELGRGVQAFTLFGSMTFEGMRRRFEKDIQSMNKNQKPMSPETQEKLREIYDKMQKVKEASPGSDAFTQSDNLVLTTLGQEAANLVATEIKTPFINALTYYWYASMLSGLSTQGINVFGSFQNVLLRSLGMAALSPANANAMMRGYTKGIRKAILASESAARGRKPSTGKLDASGNRRTEVPILKSENKIWQTLVNDPVNFVNQFHKYVFRALNVGDAFFYNGAKEGAAYFAASRVLRDKGYRGSTLAAKISNAMHDSTAEMESALAQSRKEWESSGIKFTEKDVALRAFEITEQRRPEVIRNRSHRFGQLSTYVEPPSGLLGELALGLNSLIKHIAPLRLNFPFVNVVANVLSQSLDFTPIGTLRAALGGHVNDTLNTKFGNPRGERFNPDERLHRLGASLLGMTAAAFVYARAEDELDKENPSFAIWARGPRSPGKVEALKAQGWTPYSFKLNDKFYKFSETALAPMFAWIGEMHDAYRYSPSYNKKEVSKKFVYGLSQVGNVIMDMGFLRGVADLTDSLNGVKDSGQLIIRPAKALVPFSGLARDLAKTTDDFEVDSKSYEAQFLKGIPWIQSYGAKPALNGFGEPIEMHKIADGIPVVSQIATPVVGRMVSSAEVEPEWKFLNDNGLYIPKMLTSTAVGVSSPSQGQKGKIAKLKEARAEEMGRAAAEVLSYEEIYDITKLAGPKIKTGVQNLMKGRELPKDKLQKEFDKIVDKARREAKVEYFGY